MMHRSRGGGGGDCVSLCEVHGRLLSGTAGSMLRRDSGGEREAHGPFSFLVFLLFFFRSGQER